MYWEDDNTSQWTVRVAESNKLIPNVNKTKLMMFTPRPVDDLPDIFFDGKKLEWVSDIKYLGMTIDNKLNFTLHTQEVYRKLSKYQGIFYSLSSLLPQSTLLSMYYSLVYPVIIQNVIVWGGVLLRTKFLSTPGDKSTATAPFWTAGWWWRYDCSTT